MEDCGKGERDMVLSCLKAICADENARHADRIAAAKLLLEYTSDPGREAIRVVLEGVPEEYLV